MGDAGIEGVEERFTVGEGNGEEPRVERHERVILQRHAERVALVEADDEIGAAAADGIVVKAAQQRAEDAQIVIVDGDEAGVEEREALARAWQAKGATQRRRRQTAERAAVARSMKPTWACRS